MEETEIKTVIYALILALMLLAPVKGLNVANLEPVEVVYLRMDDDRVCIQTDTKAVGFGETALKALENMEERTPGVIYLDTAEYLLVDPNALAYVEELRHKFKGKVKLCAAVDVDLSCAAEYLETHGNLPQMKSWKTGDSLPLWNGEKILKK